MNFFTADHPFYPVQFRAKPPPGAHPKATVTGVVPMPPYSKVIATAQTAAILLYPSGLGCRLSELKSAEPGL